jgi:hypothetical protein
MSIAEFQTDYFTYLNKLRDSGITNMLGAGAYLQDEFELEPDEAKEVLLRWMQSFKQEEAS